MEKSLLDRFYVWTITRKNVIIQGFKVFYLILLILLCVGGRSIYYQDKNFAFFYAIGISCGRIALIFFILALIPGITSRFGLKHKLLSLLRIFRRYIGISMYLFVIIHSSFVKFLTILALKQILPFLLFELFGLSAFIVLFFLFITSNDFSVNHLGIWWYRLHRLIYLAMWLIFFHVALQRLSIWSVLFGVTLCFQVLSFFVSAIIRATRQNYIL